jgi:hypothetical protein
MLFNNNTQIVLSFSAFCLKKGNSVREEVEGKDHEKILLQKSQEDLCGGNSISTFDEDASRLIFPARTASYRAASSGKSSD